VIEIVARALAHALDRRSAISVFEAQRKGRRLVIVDGAQPIAPGGQQMAAAACCIAALVTCVRYPSPFPEPAEIVGNIDAAGGNAAFRHRRTALLCGAKQSRELDRQILALGPPSPPLKIAFKFHEMNIQSITPLIDFISHRVRSGQALRTHSPPVSLAGHES
jgi:hypothetical protein